MENKKTKKEILVVLGTRPEAIKLFPVILELRERDIDVTVVATGQHTDLVYEVFEETGIFPDIEFSAIEHSVGFANSSLPYILDKLDGILDCVRPDAVIVQGDTSSALAGALFAFNHGIKLAHVEAGLRTYQKEPYPEEANRQIISRIADYHFCPTELTHNNLTIEMVGGNKYVVGNTEIDAMYYALDCCTPKKGYKSLEDMPSIIVTLHRRESIGVPMRNVCRDIVEIANSTAVDIIVTKHPNPGVSEIIESELGDVELLSNSSIMVVPPMDFVSFVHQMAKSTLIITDSGGVQESASALGVPVVIARDTTDRPEALESSILAGTNKGGVYTATMSLLTSATKYDKLSHAACPFGDGSAAKQIVNIMAEELCM